MAKYFSISEMLKSDTAIKKRIWNGATIEQEANLTALISAVLDPLRLFYGKSIVVTSGFRCSALNKAVGGVWNSQHLKGEAADISGGNKIENRKLMRLIVELNLPFDQVIDEKDFSWVHVSYKRIGDNRGQILRYNGRSYTGIKKEDI